MFYDVLWCSTTLWLPQSSKHQAGRMLGHRSRKPPMAIDTLGLEMESKEFKKVQWSKTEFWTTESKQAYTGIPAKLVRKNIARTCWSRAKIPWLQWSFGWLNLDCFVKKLKITVARRLQICLAKQHIMHILFQKFGNSIADITAVA